MYFGIFSVLSAYIYFMSMNWILERILHGQVKNYFIRHELMTEMYWFMICRLFLPCSFIPLYSATANILQFPGPTFPPVLFQRIFGHLTPAGLLSYVWLIGAAVTLTIYFRNRESEKEIARGLIAQGRITTVSELLPDYIGPEVRVCITKGIKTPFVYGFSSVIMLPDRPYSESQLFYVLNHELQHLYNKDADYLFLAHILKRIYWFMPGLSRFVRNCSSLIELRVDGILMNRFSAASQIAYCEELLNSSRPDNNPLQVMGHENAYVVNENSILPGSGKTAAAGSSLNMNPVLSKSSAAGSLRSMHFAEPNTSLTVRIKYCLNSPDKRSLPNHSHTELGFLFLMSFLPMFPL